MPPPAYQPGLELTSVVNAAPVGVLIMSSQGKMLYVNHALERMFGYTADQMLGQVVEMLLPEHIRERHVGFRTFFFQNPEPRTMGSGRELFALHALGHQFSIEIGLGSVLHLGQRCAVAFVSDITERKRFESRFAQVVTSLPVGLVMMGGDGCITMTNPALDHLFGYAAGELIGQAIEVLLPERIRQRHPDMRNAFFSAPTVRSMGSGRDLMAQHKNGVEFPVEIGLTPIDTHGEKLVLAAVTDISLRKKFEETLHQANAQLEEFTYVASHDLRSPLRGIADLLTWIQEDLEGTPLSEAIHNNFRRAQERIARAERMIDDLLEYARAGDTPEQREMVDPQALVHEAIALLTVPPGFTVEIDVPAQPFVTARTPLSLAIRNLLANAFKHHGGTHGLVRVSLREEGRFYVFCVEDDGQGVPAGAQDRIFKLFHRATATTQGHGVGLAVTRRMVNSNGGTVVLDRTGGSLQGACFRVHWPRFQLKDIH